MLIVQDGIEPHYLVAMHHDFLSILRFHDLALFHSHGTPKLVLHAHLAVLEDIDRRAILELDRFLNL